MESLLWAASCMRNIRITSIRFETDCSDLVDMTENPMDWPKFTAEIEAFQRLHEDFEDVSLSHILRSRNGRADALAKNARTRGYLFFHIDQTRTDGDALSRIGSSVLHLICKRLFLARVKRLQVGEWRFHENFSFTPATGKYRPTSHKFKLHYMWILLTLPFFNFYLTTLL